MVPDAKEYILESIVDPEAVYESQRRSAGICLDRLHAVVGQAEMMADLMD
jgi:hypothetical protein